MRAKVASPVGLEIIKVDPWNTTNFRCLKSLKVRVTDSLDVPMNTPISS